MPNNSANQDGLQPNLQSGAGAESGSNRSSEHFQRAPGHHNTVPEPTAHVGSTTSRTPAAGNQGISNGPAAEEDERQQSVVERRPDAKAGLNSIARKDEKPLRRVS